LQGCLPDIKCEDGCHLFGTRATGSNSETLKGQRSAKTFSLLSNTLQVMCIGRNYADHIKELSSATPKQPFFFLKPPSSILLPGAGPVLRPRGVNMHYEVELGLIMGKTLRDLHPEDTKGAMDAIEGTKNAIHPAENNSISRSVRLTFTTQATFSLSI